ncbi:hypothetical protein ACFQUU_08525 [Herbaspirillum sp. GCM10030257]|uniref:hypothetical protein n=1 Tax=Herbaspirillum sp. GCM10030257 TaxID=3273393 RepID=UPI0036232B5E
MSELKAFHAQGDEYGKIIFAKSHVEARRLAAGELGCEFQEIESCRRIPSLDQYAATGKIPAKDLIEDHGWWFECAGCSTRVDSDNFDYANEQRREAVYVDDVVYCCQSCKASEDARVAEIMRLEDEVTATALEKWPGITIVHANGHVNRFQNAFVDFSYPGGKYSARWNLGEETVSVVATELEAWNAFASRLKRAA